MTRKNKIILISGTAARLVDFEKNGFFDRQRKLVNEYGKYFDVEYYTSDFANYSDKLSVTHYNLPFRINIYGVRHILFWLYLVLRAPFMKGPIRVFGVAIPTLPLVKFLSRQKIVIGFQWDYAGQTKENYKGIKRLLAGYIEQASFFAADTVICTMNWLQNIAEQKYKKQTVVIPNFVDLEKFVRTEQKDDIILYAGRLHWSKGVEVLINAFGILKNEFNNFQLHICGDGEIRTKLEELIKKMEINDVKFHGVLRQDILAQFMGKAKVFVLPTITYEGHPKALIEAMVSGTACVATDVPGNRDVITHGITGLLVKPDNVSELCKAMKRIIGDDLLRTRLEKKSHQFASENYCIEHTLREEIRVMENITTKPNVGI
ncbi:MAG: glycosyltransferase family 4 protein [Bacteroidota bacterium]|nr:glycosyltransferase family 4 protein [Bacteroidota bacterium]